MIRNQRRSISAEDTKIIEEINSKQQKNNNAPTLNEHRDVILQIKKRNFWKEDKDNDVVNSTVTIPLSEYVTRMFLSQNYYNKTEINDFIENFGIKIITLESESQLPQEGDSKYGNSSYIYFVRHNHLTDSNSNRDIYDEYIWDSETNNYERIGNTDIDLSGYLRTTDFDSWINSEYNVVIADINSDISNLENNKVSVSTFNTTVTNIENELSTKTNISDVNSAIEEQLIGALTELISDLS